MSSFNINHLNNGISLITRKNPNTPRIALSMFIDSGIINENKAGIASLSGRLLLQGTETRSAEELVTELDSNAIEMSCDIKQDYIRLKAVFLNEDFDKAVDILADVVKHSTFQTFEKEVRKFKGEMEVDLDSPKVKVGDNLIKNMYPDHPYGHTYSKVMEALPSIDMSMVKGFYYDTALPRRINISIVGNIDEDKIKKVFEDKFGSLKRDYDSPDILKVNEIKKNEIVTISKDDAAQAQIIQGWIAPDITNEDSFALIMLNIILGSSGLSSRLFTELRDKKGLAYHVRSSYDPLKYSGIFTIYIGTAPVNINTAIEGFNTEIKRLQEELVTDKELEDAKNNYLGKRAFFHETNSQQSHYLGFYDIIGLGADYDDKIPEKVKKVTAQDIREVANKYLTRNSIVSIVAPQQYIDTIRTDIVFP